MIERSVIHTPNAPVPVTNAYSQAVKVSAGSFLFCTGQTSRDPVSGDIVHKGDVVAQAEQSLRNLQAIIEAAGGSLANVVRLGIYYRNKQDMTRVAAVRRAFFGDEPPASTGVQVQLVDDDLLIEIDAIVALD